MPGVKLGHWGHKYRDLVFRSGLGRKADELAVYKNIVAESREMKS
jgi:hypothetical protein